MRRVNNFEINEYRSTVKPNFQVIVLRITGVS